MKLKMVLFYPAVSAVNFLLGYFSRVYMLAAFYSLIYYIDGKQGVPQWCYHLSGILMFLMWFFLFLLINYSCCYVAEKKNTLQLYIVQMLVSAGGFIMAFIIS